MADYITAQELANEWGFSLNWIYHLCRNGKVPGAFKSSGVWKIPKETKENGHSLEEEGSFRFIDLCAGIGGFHQAMKALGGICVMASEIDSACVNVYRQNYQTTEGIVRGDLSKIDPNSIPNFEVLCAGFPCQPFSKAGRQEGFKDKLRGNLFYTIMNILDSHNECNFVILENVRNLADKPEHWSIIQNELLKRDFIITKDPLILSPSDFGIPQIRERLYILGIKKEKCNELIKFKGYIDSDDLCLYYYKQKCKIGDALSILEKQVSESYKISEEQALMIEAWDEFRKGTHITTIGFPIWISHFGLNIDDSEEYKKSVAYDNMPNWKKNYTNKNRELYLNNKEFIDSWINKYNMLKRIKLYQKFEWNCGEDVNDIHDAIIQIRQSGIRVKRSDYFPSLVAIVNTPIIWDTDMNSYRFITPREAANLQNFDYKFKFVGTDKQIYKQLGNAVNVHIVKILAENLFALCIED